MSTPYDIQDDMRSALLAYAPLTAWLVANFSGAVLTVMLGNRKNKTVAAATFPNAAIVLDPVSVENQYTGCPAHFNEKYHVQLGLRFDKNTPLDDGHLQLLGQFEELAAKAILEDRRRSGMAEGTVAFDRESDSQVNHPFHFFTIIFEVQRTAPY